MENKRRFSVMQIVAMAVDGLFLLLLLIDVALRILLECGINLYFESFSCSDICNGLRIILIILLPVAVGCSLFGFVKIIALNIVSTLVCGFIAFVLFCGALFGMPSHSYYEYTSPDGQHELVFQENIYFMIFDVSVYEKTSNNVMCKIGQCNQENFYPYDLTQYDVSWSDEGFSVVVYSNRQPEILEFEYYKK